MNLHLPRYIYGMLQTPDKKNVYGDLQPIAYSQDFSEKLQREVYKRIRLGLSGDLLQETVHAYGFFSLSDNDYIAAHYELMELTEQTSRGNPIFSEYFHVTLSQLESIGWNLYAIFKSFNNIKYYEQISRNILPVEVVFNNGDEWKENLNLFSLHAEAILVRYLSSSEKVVIISPPKDIEIRLKLFCSLFQCLPHSPHRYLKDLTFATVAKSTSDSARIIFSSNQSINGQVVDWTAPNVPSLPGSIYANWVSSLSAICEARTFQEEISNLVLVKNSEHLDTLGEELDLAIHYKEWKLNRNEYLAIKVLGQLERLAKEINNFSPILNLQEAEAWLSHILVFVLKLSAYDIGLISLSHYESLISEKQARKSLVERIAHTVITNKNEGYLDTLAEFIKRVTEHGHKTNKSTLVDFCEEIVLQCLSSEDYKSALILWVKIKHLEWALKPEWFNGAVAALPSNIEIQDLVFIFNTIGCPSNIQSFASLLEIINKSSNLINLIPETIRFLETQAYNRPQEFSNSVFNCFMEVKSYGWVATQIVFGYENIEDYTEALPDLISLFDKVDIDIFFDYAISNQNDLLAILIAFSIIAVEIKKPQSSAQYIVKYLLPVKEYSSRYFDIGLVILKRHWEYFSIDQLLLILNILETKQRKYTNINHCVLEINHTLQKKKRIGRIQNIFSHKINKNNLGHIIFDCIMDISRSMDVEAWKLFEKLLRDKGYSADYQENLLQILLKNNYFSLDDDQLEEFSILLNSAGLLYEADLFVYWMFFHKKLNISPIPSIYRTLDFYCVLPKTAGLIIDYDLVSNRRKMRALSGKLASIAPSETEFLIQKLDTYISKYPVNSLKIKLKSMFSDVAPETIWLECCKILSKSLKSEIQKTNRRN